MTRRPRAPEERMSTTEILLHRGYSTRADELAENEAAFAKIDADMHRAIDDRLKMHFLGDLIGTSTFETPAAQSIDDVMGELEKWSRAAMKLPYEEFVASFWLPSMRVAWPMPVEPVPSFAERLMMTYPLHFMPPAPAASFFNITAVEGGPSITATGCSARAWRALKLWSKKPHDRRRIKRAFRIIRQEERKLQSRPARILEYDRITA